jgi:alpha-beta hydrolase superfamily lysophospholipase
MKNFTLQISKEVTLSGKGWEIADAKANLILIHGAGEHIGRYDHWAKYFNSQKINVFGTDHFGHGNSPGIRGHFPDYQIYLDEVKALINKTKEEFPGLPLIIYGHSLGGNIILNWILENEESYDYAIASAPWIRLKLVPPKWKINLMNLLGGLLPALSQKNELDPIWLSRDSNVVADYIKDPLVHNNITLSAAKALFERAEILNTFNRQINDKVLLIHGLDDNITDSLASKEFADRTGVDFYGAKGLFHEIHNEPEQVEIFNYICNWLNKNGL